MYYAYLVRECVVCTSIYAKINVSAPLGLVYLLSLNPWSHAFTGTYKLHIQCILSYPLCQAQEVLLSTVINGVGPAERWASVQVLVCARVCTAPVISELLHHLHDSQHHQSGRRERAADLLARSSANTVSLPCMHVHVHVHFIMWMLLNHWCMDLHVHVLYTCTCSYYDYSNFSFGCCIDAYNQVVLNIYGCWLLPSNQSCRLQETHR